MRDHVDLDSASGVYDRLAPTELVARAAAYSDDEVPQCLELEARLLAMLTAGDLPESGVVSLPVLVPEDRLETPTAWVRLYLPARITPVDSQSTLFLWLMPNA